MQAGFFFWDIIKNHYCPAKFEQILHSAANDRYTYLSVY